jgi:malonyl-CoA O-methyltransferase
MAEIVLPSRASVRRAFSRAAGHYDEHAFLQREIGARLLQHLEGLRIEPARILDLGCGTGSAFAPLRERFGKARIVGIDLALPMLMHARARGSWWQRWRGEAPSLACADAEALPLANASQQMVHSNLTLQWCDPARAFAEAARVLSAEGLVIFSTFGPDTLKELRAACAAAGAPDRVNAFVDMHDLGDALVHAGFADPVMDMEVLTLEYASVERLVRDLKGISATALTAPGAGLGARGRWRRVVAEYERLRRDDALPATYEVVYGHAWKPAPRVDDAGRAIMRFHARRPA